MSDENSNEEMLKAEYVKLVSLFEAAKEKFHKVNHDIGVISSEIAKCEDSKCCRQQECARYKSLTNALAGAHIALELAQDDCIFYAKMLKVYSKWTK